MHVMCPQAAGGAARGCAALTGDQEYCASLPGMRCVWKDDFVMQVMCNAGGWRRGEGVCSADGRPGVQQPLPAAAHDAAAAPAARRAVRGRRLLRGRHRHCEGAPRRLAGGAHLCLRPSAVVVAHMRTILLKFKCPM